MVLLKLLLLVLSISLEPYLHSNMVLLKLFLSKSNIPVFNKFTFQYGTT